MTRINTLILLLAGLTFTWANPVIDFSIGGVADYAKIKQGPNKEATYYDQETEELLQRNPYDYNLAKINSKGVDLGLKLRLEISRYFDIQFLGDMMVTLGTFRYKMHDFDKKWNVYKGGSTLHYQLGTGLIYKPFADTNSVLHGFYISGAVGIGLINLWNGEENDVETDEFDIDFTWTTFDIIAEVGKLWKISNDFYFGPYFKYKPSFFGGSDTKNSDHTFGGGIIASWKML